METVRKTITCDVEGCREYLSLITTRAWPWFRALARHEGWSKAGSPPNIVWKCSKHSKEGA